MEAEAVRRRCNCRSSTEVLRNAPQYVCVLRVVRDESYRALMSETRRERFESVHTAKMVESRRELIRPELEHRMDVVQRIVGLVRSMRQKTSLKTRQPLLRIAIPASEETRLLIEQMNDVILEEINVKTIEFIDES